jgi:transposase
MHILGIDIAKASFNVTLLGGQQPFQGKFDNNEDGFSKLRRWLKKRKAKQVHACLEATGQYWEALALFLHKEGQRVSVVNPKLIKRHAQSIMQRNKTDRQDAATIADYCLRQTPDLWSPPPMANRRLRTMVRHLQMLKASRTRETNRLKSNISEPTVQQLIEEHLTFLDQQIAALQQEIADHIDQHPQLKEDKELLTSIPGIADTTAALFLAEVPDVSRFQQASQLAAFAGLTPAQQQSGSSVRRPGRLVKWGNAHLRAAFYMPALSAHRFNPLVAALRTRLLARGKSKMTVVVACMRKLLHLAYGVLKTRKPFDSYHTVNVQGT